MVDFINVHYSTQNGYYGYANRDLQPGDIILREAPVFVVESPSTHSTDGHGSFLNSIFSAKDIPASTIDDETRKLSPEQKAEFQKVSCEEDTDISRFRSVHYDIRPKHNEAPTAFGVFLKGAYVNHSCRPNSLYFWDEETKSLVLVALEHIAAGQDISISYLPMFNWEIVAERRALLQNLFPFECQCMACNVESSDTTVSAHRRKLRDLHMSLVYVASSHDGNTRSSSVDIEHLVDTYLTAITQELQPDQTLDPRLYKA